MKNYLIIIFSIFIFVGCKNQSINDKSKRNANWVWWVDANTGKGAWVPFGTKTTVSDGYYTEFYANGNIYEHGKLANRKNIDTVFLYDKEGKLLEYDIINPTDTSNYISLKETDSFSRYIINDGNYHRYKNDGKTLLEEGYSKNHTNYGLWTCYDDNGSKEFIENYVKDSNWRVNFYKNGQKKDSSFDFKNNGVYASCKNWYDNGQLQEEAQWENGVQNGIQKEYYEEFNKPQSVLKTVSTWENGVENGIQLDYYSNGILKDSLNLINGVPDGISKTYYENSGKLEKIMTWQNGIQNGIAVRYYEGGELEDSFNVSNGNVDGLKKRWYENGKLQLVSIYENGNCVREKKYNDDGTLSSDSTY